MEEFNYLLNPYGLYITPNVSVVSQIQLMLKSFGRVSIYDKDADLVCLLKHLLNEAYEHDRRLEIL